MILTIKDGASSYSVSTASPQDSPEAWNSLSLIGSSGDVVRVPGWVDFPRAPVGRKIDEKPSPGSEAFALTDKGAACADVLITFHVMPKDLEEFGQVFAKYLDPRRKLSKRAVVSVAHPSLYQAGIKALYFYEASLIQPSSGGGVTAYRVETKAKEFNAKTAIGDGSKKVKADLSRIGKSAKWADSKINPPGTPAAKAADPTVKFVADVAEKVPDDW